GRASGDGRAGLRARLPAGSSYIEVWSVPAACALPHSTRPGGVRSPMRPGRILAPVDRMTSDERQHPKDVVPPHEGVVIPADELDRVNDRAPTEGVDPVNDDADVLDKRPTDGPL